MRLFRRLFASGSLVILDDYFPNLYEAYKISEYNHYLASFRDCRIYSSAVDYDPFYEQYREIYPGNAGRVSRLEWGGRYRCSLFYTMFLNAVYSFLPIFECERTPFVFTLYPGGGFWLDSPESDAKLAAVCGSSLMKKVIATQKVTYDYLRRKKFCAAGNIEYIYGGVPPRRYFDSPPAVKSFYKKDKQTFDICFVAVKYMEKGIDKGYDTFIDVACRLKDLANDIMFHVVGNFGEADIDVGPLAGRIRFYGLRETSFFPGFFAGMDLIISPHVPFKLFPGNFDGFLTGGCVEAGFCGVAVFTTDALACNTHFVDGTDIRIINADAGEIAALAAYYRANPAELYRLAALGQRKFRRVFGYEEQLGRRVSLLRQYL